MAFSTAKHLKDVDASTFDIVKVDAFHNTRFGTVFFYIWQWFQLLLMIAILAADTYTCVNILAFNRWSSNDYEVYQYKVAKWIFTGCILFRYALLIYQLAWGIYIFRTRNIALAYLNNKASLMYRLRHYDYHCLFYDIKQEGFFDWAAFLVYQELDNALEVLVADTPRQVINILTLRYYATGGDQNNDILANIKAIATTNVRLSVILSLQLASLVLFGFFFFKFCLGMLLYIPIRVKVSHKGYKSMKSYCYENVNDKVRFLVSRNHKSRKQILEEGILDIEAIRGNPLLASESSLDLQAGFPPFGRSQTADTFDSLRKPLPAARSVTALSGPYENYRGVSGNPFADSQATLRKQPSTNFYEHSFGSNPFMDSKVDVPLEELQPANGSVASLAQKNMSASSLTEDVASSVCPAEGSDCSLLEATDTPLLPKSESYPESFVSGMSTASCKEEEDDDDDDDCSDNTPNPQNDTAPYPVRGVSVYAEDGLNDFSRN